MFTGVLNGFAPQLIETNFEHGYLLFPICPGENLTASIKPNHDPQKVQLHAHHLLDLNIDIPATAVPEGFKHVMVITRQPLVEGTEVHLIGIFLFGIHIEHGDPLGG